MATAARAPTHGPDSWRIWKDLSLRDLIRVPGLLSLSRIPLAAAFALTIGRPALSIGVLLLAGATDLLDGWYARRFHQETRTGAALDGITDKIFILGVVIALVASGSLSIIEVLLLGSRDIGELALAIRLAGDRKRRKRVMVRPANVGGKIATALQYAAIIAVLLGSDHRAILVGAAALAGILASASYWARDVEASRAATADDEPGAGTASDG